MTLSVPPRKCASCQSENLEYGDLGVHSVVFFPFDRGAVDTIFGGGFTASVYVCLDCGLLGHYLEKPKLQTLRDDVAHHKTKSKK